MQSWCVPAQAEVRFSLFSSVGQAFLLQWTEWPVLFVFLGLRFQPGHLSFPELTSLLKCLRGRGEGIYCPQRSASSLKILRLCFIVKLYVFFLLCIVLYFNIKIILWVAMRRSKSKPNFLLSWLSGDTVLLNLLKFGGCFDLVRADPTDQTQYLRSVFSVLVTGSFENSVSFPCRCREQVFCCFISHLLKSDWACWCMCCGCPVALLTST